MDTHLGRYLTIDPAASSPVNERGSVSGSSSGSGSGGTFVGPAHAVHSIDAFPSPSDVINESSSRTGVSVSATKKEGFDREWREQLRRCFDAGGPSTAKELDEFLATGRSNGYRLRLQVMVLPPGEYWKIHCHTNMEFETTLVGTLREFRWLTFNLPADELTRDTGNLTGPDIAAERPFVERRVAGGQCMLNAIGSVHQSFTGAGEGCALLVLWSGCHANTHPSRVYNRDHRLRPGAGW